MFGLTLQMVGSPEGSRWGKAGGVLDLCLHLENEQRASMEEVEPTNRAREVVAGRGC